MKFLTIFFITMSFIAQAAAMGKGPGDVPPYGELAIMQGPTGLDRTSVVVLQTALSRFTYELVDTTDLRRIPPASTAIGGMPSSGWRIAQLHYDGLVLGRDYFFKVLDGRGAAVDQRILRTLDLNRRTARIVLASCMNDGEKVFRKTMWESVERQDADAIFFLGDNVYGDFLTFPAPPAWLWHRYVQARNRLAIFRMPVLTPIFATWDDHDYGANNHNRRYKHKDQARRIFDLFFPRGPVGPHLEPGPGVASVFRAWGQRFLFLDDRTFRSPPRATDQTHWGDAQWGWMKDRLRESDEPAWLINGSQFFGLYQGEESVQREHPDSLWALMDELYRRGPAVLISGDRHYSEIMRLEGHLGYPLYEITSSGIHSGRTKDIGENPFRLVGTGERNYLSVDVEPAPGGVRLAITSLGEGDKVYFSKTLTVSRQEPVPVSASDGGGSGAPGRRPRRP